MAETSLSDPRAQNGGHEEGVTPAPSTASTIEAADAPGVNARSALGLIGLVVAPTTLVTALAYYFGWVLTNAKAKYFGIDPSVFGFSTSDYILRSINALFVPLGVVLAIAIASVWIHGFVVGHFAHHRERMRLRAAASLAVIAGAVVFAVGAAALLGWFSTSQYNLIPSAFPGIGIALMAYGTHLLAHIHAAERPDSAAVSIAAQRGLILPLVVLLIILSGFWTAARYANGIGHSEAAHTAATLTSQPAVTVFTAEPLDIAGDGVTEHQLTGGSPSGYSYSGLRLLVHSDGKYFLMPDDWTPSRGSVIVIDDLPQYDFTFGGAGSGAKTLVNNGSSGSTRFVLPAPATACRGGCGGGSASSKLRSRGR